MLTHKFAIALYNGPYRWFGLDQTRIVLILCHARSGSTLLNHILLSNPQIISNGERMFNYKSENDLDLFIMTMRLRQRNFIKQCNFVVDQLTATERLANHELLNSPRVKVIFLIREPEAAIASMVKLSKEGNSGWNISKAIEYYIERLKMLATYGNGLNNKSNGLFITYHDLVNKTDPTLARLQKFLLLKEPLNEQYPIQSFTGIHGDPSKTIRTGHIVHNKTPAKIDCSHELMEQLKNSYSECLQKLMVFK